MPDRPDSRPVVPALSSPTATLLSSVVRGTITAARILLAGALTIVGGVLVLGYGAGVVEGWDPVVNDDFTPTGWYYFLTWFAVLGLVLLGTVGMLFWRRDRPQRWLLLGASSAVLMLVLPVVAALIGYEATPSDSIFARAQRREDLIGGVLLSVELAGVLAAVFGLLVFPASRLINWWCNGRARRIHTHHC